MELINLVIESIGAILITLLSVLPDSPFQTIQNIDGGILQSINWILPISQAVAHLELYITAVAIYYALRLIMRWVKAAGS